ncbi:SDR family oxidoreductase [Pelagibacterales bacterium SAG-MED35]|nr:SDR family oxidoreductase [Pelagibacterales bacterium SAG-MED35]
MKKKILILGASGMLGSTLYTFLNNQNLNVIGIARKNVFKNKSKIAIYRKLTFNNIDNIINKLKPDYLINCTGVINHKIKKNLDEVFYINSVLPHYIAKKCLEKKIINIHISTDCVFNGKIGNYSEKNLTNSIDYYGISKSIGEVIMPYTIIIRTSIIGNEINSNHGLLEWFLSHKKFQTVNGFSKAYFSGLTTLELSKIILKYFINKKRKFKSPIHISGPKINKYDLISIINKVYNKKVIINKNSSFKVDKSLNSSIFVKSSGYKIKSWQKMLQENKIFNEKFF